MKFDFIDLLLKKDVQMLWFRRDMYIKCKLKYNLIFSFIHTYATNGIKNLQTLNFFFEYCKTN